MTVSARLFALTATFASLFCHAQNAVITTTNVPLRMMGANLTTGNYQRWESPGTNILVGLEPDVVAIQEFKFVSPTGLGTSTPAALRQMVDLCFGTNFSYYREPYDASGDLPNGIISRWPIVASGSWPSPQVSNRGFAWAQIRPPGTNDLYVVSVHLHTANASSRATEAGVIKSNIQHFFPTKAWVIVAGDFNTDNRSEAAVTTFKTVLSDSPIPADQNGNSNTSAPRSKPYDYVLPSFNFTNSLVPVVINSRTFNNGLVFDSRVYTPLAEVAPVVSTDSGASNMQHMAVVKDFRVTWAVTNYAPFIVTQPEPQSVVAGGTATFSLVVTGTPPLSYQWRRSGTPVAGATQSNLVLTNVQTGVQGDYSVIVTNPFGSATSTIAPLTLATPPSITQPPASQSVNQGASATFTVSASGSLPLGYQWRFGGASLPGATSTSYTRSNVQPATQGAYSVLVTNTAGSITSTPAALTLVVPAPSLRIQAPSLLSWAGLSNLPYRVESCTNAGAPYWSTLGVATAPGTNVVFSNSAVQDFSRLFRVTYP